MNQVNLLIAVLLFTLSPASALSKTVAYVLAIEVSGGKAGKGQILLSIFTSTDNYLKEPQYRATEQVDEKGTARFRITDLKAGEYAISAIYDEDLNDKLNTGLFGIPTELVGFSNNVKSNWGPPSYDDVSITIPPTEEITIYLDSPE